MAQSGWGAVNDEQVKSLPTLMAPMEGEDDKKPRSWPFSAHFQQIKTEENTAAPTIKPMKQIKSETDGEECGRPELTSNPEPNSHLQPHIDRKASGSSDKHLSHFGPKMEDDDEGWNDNKPHGSGVNGQVECYTAKKSLSCSECGGDFDSQQSLQRHLTKRSLRCWNSKKGFRETQDVNIQGRIHAGNNTFICDVCDKVLSNKDCLRKHMRIHTGNKTVPCDICGKVLSHKKNLRNHMKIHAGDKPFSCDECGHSFSQMSNLKKHMRIHTGEKPFSCDECGQRFCQKSSLSKHMRIHTGAKPYKCDECGQRFSRKENLKQHLRIHTGERPYTCDKCGQRFGQKSHLNQHIRVHTGNGPFACEVSGKFFRWLCSLKGHACPHKVKQTQLKDFATSL